MGNAIATSSFRLRRSSMDVYDKLPKSVRLALQQSDHNWSGEQLYRAYKRKHPAVRTAALCIETLRKHDRDKHLADAAEGLVCPGQR